MTIASALAGGYICYCRRKFQNICRVHVDEALAKDLGDIVAGFRLHYSEDKRAFVPSGPSGFWVAEDGNEVIGCIGLGKWYSKLERRYVPY